MSSQVTPPPPKRNSLSQKRGPSTVKKSAQSENGAAAANGNNSKPSSPPQTSVGGERTVKKLRLSKALTIPEGTTVSDACRRMAARRVDAVLLTDANALLSGIITDKDIATRVIAEGLRPEQTVVSKIMTRNPVFVTSDTLAIEALQKMVQGKFRHLPVVENGEVIALLDITKCLYDAISRMEKAAEQGSAIAAAVEGVERQWGSNFSVPYAFIETLRERMFKPALSTIIAENSRVAIVSLSDPVYVATKKMRDLRVNSVVIVTGNKIQGILTSKDILMRVVAQNLSPELTLVEKVMTPNPECAALETTILDALHLMHDGKFLHLPVVDKDGCVAACVDVLQITHAAISMVESGSGAVNDMANTMMQRFWDSVLTLEPADDYDTHSEMSAMVQSDGAETTKQSYPSLGLGNSFAFKFEDLKGRMHRFNCGTESLEELVSTVVKRVGSSDDHGHPQLLYEDDEGDKVLLTTDGDLIGAVGQARKSSKPYHHRHRNRARKRRELDGREMKGPELELPPGFRFHPTDDELVNHYLCRKCANQPLAVPIIAEIDLYKFDPWQLPGVALYGEKEWYFFSPRDRKYPNGSRPNRAAGTGYWKATGADKPIGKPNTLGIKKALVFYAGKAPRGIKTNWIMHEYRLANVDRSAGKKNNLRLDDWVLCRIYNKKGRIEKLDPVSYPEADEEKPNIPKSVHNMVRPVDHMEASDSMPRLHTDSSSSDQDQVASPEVRCEREVQSQPKWADLGSLDFQFNYLDGFQDDPFASQVNFPVDQISPLQDMFMFLQKPF